MLKKLLGIKIFSVKDQKLFLKLSLDYNPAHILKKNKTHQFNTKKPVVHGVNILLNSMEMLLNFQKIKFQNMKCFFLKPIYLNEKIYFYLYFENKKEIYIEAQNKNKNICTKIIFSNSKNKITSKFEEKNFRLIKSKKKFSNYPVKYLQNKYKINFNKVINNNYYPFINKVFGKYFCEALFKTSYFVGMKCPGKNALFSNIDLNLKNFHNLKKYLIFYVSDYDKRIKLFTITVQGYLNISLKSFHKIK